MSIDRRKQIVEAAGKSFALFGYKATTMEQVAKIAGVGKGTIYTFFSHKEELFDEIMRSVIQEMRQVAENMIDPGKPLFENLHPLLSKLLDLRRTQELIIRLSHEIKEMGTPKAQEAMQQIEHAVIAFIANIIAEAVGKGEIRPCEPEVTAFFILKMYIAFVHDWEITHPPLSNERIAELMQMYLVEGLAVK